MKILNLSHTDWANFQYDNMLALRAAGLECDSITGNKHPFYEKQSEVLNNLSNVMDRIQDYDVIQFFHDNIHFFKLVLPALKGKKVIVYHTSSAYRKDFEAINALMNPHVYKSVNAMPEFMGKGAKDEIYMVGAVDTEKLSAKRKDPEEPYLFAHYPSNPDVKGTEKIVELMQLTDVRFRYSIERVPYSEQLQRVSRCDVYIEMFTEVDGNGMPYGNFGIQALEAAAMGKIVITNCNDWKIYYDVYGQLPFVIIRSKNELIKQVILYNSVPVAEHQEKAMNIVHANHSYKATGEYFLRNVLSEL